MPGSDGGVEDAGLSGSDGGVGDAGMPGSDGGVGDAGTGSACGVIQPSSVPDPLRRTLKRLSEGETCGVAYLDHSGFFMQRDELMIEHLTQLWFLNLHDPNESTYQLNEHITQYLGPLTLGFAFSNVPIPVVPGHPMFNLVGRAFSTPPSGNPFFQFPSPPASGAEDPSGGVAIIGGVGDNFPCDCPTGPDGNAPLCTCSDPAGLYFARYDGDAGQRFLAPRLFDAPSDANAQVTTGVDVNGWGLGIVTYADGTATGRWIDPAGQPLDPFAVNGPGPALTDGALAPLAGGGLAFRRNGQWTSVLEHGSAPALPPCWLADLAGHDLRLIEHETAYAAIPTSDPGESCDRAMQLYTTDGTPCGPFPIGTADEQCSAEHVSIGPDGSVLRILDGEPVDAGPSSTSGTCLLRAWEGVLRSSP